jgi:putative Ca2+/H+ antiporter (TMEM165/GDT1 family)
MTGESLRNPGPELAEGPHGPAFVILAYAGIHSLQRVSLWIPAFAGMTGESLRNPVPELAEGPHGPAFVILAVKVLKHKNHSHRENAKSAKKHQTLLFFLCVLGVFAVKILMHKTILTAKTRRALRSIRHCFSFFAYLASLR